MAPKQLKRMIGIAGSGLFLAFILVVSFTIMNRFGDIIKDPLELRRITVSFGAWGYLFFIIINILQIFCVPLPGNVLNISAGIIFGFFKGTIVTWIGVILGGSLVLIFSRVIGKRLIHYLLNDKAASLEKVITRKGIAFIFFLSVFPNPVGDGLFYLAGITDLPLKILMPLIFLGRLPGIVVSVLIGDSIIRAGVKGWLILCAGTIIAIALYILFGKKIEQFFERFIR